ncbi:MAG: signal recognition particle-docking protein FtsY [Deltaproteobacteria bacterium]|nr:signal recognition particle-docking protein FtsY [Deltaproteobacteria bacterium]
MTGGEIAVVVIGLLLLGLVTAGIVRVVRKRAGESLAPARTPAEIEEAAEQGALPPAADAAAEAAQPAAVAAKPARPAPRLVAEEPARAETTIEPLKVTLPQEKPSLKLVPAEAPQKALRAGLAKTRGGFIAKLGRLFAGKKKIDEELLGKLEEVLFTADIGVKTSQRLFDALRAELSRSELKDAGAVWGFIRDESIRILDLPDGGAIDASRAKPFVILTIGVNGVGKTTTIGKLAALLQRGGRKVLLAAGDTFRAAAVEQLEVWGQRTRAPVVKGKEGGDPSSVVFDAIKRAREQGYDVVIADTAGRLHTKVNLMEELQKVRRVCDKAEAGAPHETLLVLDATNGQNAISQAQTFKQAMDFTGIVLTKLDGTAKGGVILGICNELKIPVRYIGVGERVDDLRPFDPGEFGAALYEKAEEAPPEPQEPQEEEEDDEEA